MLFLTCFRTLVTISTIEEQHYQQGLVATSRPGTPSPRPVRLKHSTFWIWLCFWLMIFDFPDSLRLEPSWSSCLRLLVWPQPQRLKQQPSWWSLGCRLTTSLLLCQSLKRQALVARHVQSWDVDRGRPAAARSSARKRPRQRLRTPQCYSAWYELWQGHARHNQHQLTGATMKRKKEAVHWSSFWYNDY